MKVILISKKSSLSVVSKWLICYFRFSFTDELADVCVSLANISQIVQDECFLCVWVLTSVLCNWLFRLITVNINLWSTPARDLTIHCIASELENAFFKTFSSFSSKKVISVFSICESLLLQCKLLFSYKGWFCNFI